MPRPHADRNQHRQRHGHAPTLFLLFPPPPYTHTRVPVFAPPPSPVRANQYYTTTPTTTTAVRSWSTSVWRRGWSWRCTTRPRALRWGFGARELSERASGHASFAAWPGPRNRLALIARVHTVPVCACVSVRRCCPAIAKHLDLIPLERPARPLGPPPACLPACIARTATRPARTKTRGFRTALQVRAAVESVFPISAVARYMTLQEGEKQTQVRAMCVRTAGRVGG